jgi:hypothetical protein
MRALILFLALTSTAFAQGAFGPSAGGVPGAAGVTACGATGTYPSITPTAQTNCGNVAPFPGAPSSPTLISTCSQTLVANTKYQLSSDLSCGATVLAITISGPNTILDFNGHTVTGGALLTDPNGDHVYSSVAGGTLTCNQDSGSLTACFYGNISTANLNTIGEIDHLTITNSSTGTATNSRNLLIDYGSVSTGTLLGSITTKVHNITSTSATGLTSTRIINLQVQGIAHTTIAYPEFYDNFTTCQSTAAACQGIVAFGIYNAKLHNNKVINQLASASSSETPRGTFCDQTDGCEMYSNYYNAQDGRAFRFRGSNNTHDVNSAHDDYIDNVVAGTNPNYVAAMHLGDPDTGTEVENLTVNHNVINYTSGLVSMQRDATAVTITTNVVNCVTCSGNGTPNLWWLRITAANATQGSVLGTTFNGGTPDAPQTQCDAGTTSLVCLSGTSATCTVNNGVC